MRLHLDLEVYSEVSIKDAPLDVYASHPSTKVILCAFAFDEGPVSVYEPDSQPMPKELLTALRDTSVTFVAWNTGYERTVLRYKGLDIPTSRCLDPMVYARYAGLPGKLKDCAKIPMIGVPPEAATKSETHLIKRFCMPDKNGRRIMPHEFPEDWALFVDYCRKDVLTMRAVLNWIEPRFPFPERERRLWELDQKINQRGIPVDVGFARHGVSEAARIIATAFNRLKVVTGLENPNSVQQLHPFLKERGYQYDSLGREFLEQALESDRLTPEAREVIEVRLSAAKASVKKFTVVAEMAS